MKIKKHLNRFNIHTEHIKILGLTGLIFLSLIFIFSNKIYERINLSKPVTWGVSYSPSYAASLGLDPVTTYEEILDQLGPKRVRLNTYWNEIEPVKDKFDFSQVDHYVDLAQKRQIEAVLVVGLKQPRWPECRTPGWLNIKDTDLLRERQFKMLQTVINHFDSNPAVAAWQLENEPVFSFGVCPQRGGQFLQEEVKLMRTLTKKPIILTDSGELSTWRGSMAMSDYFGTTLYRTVDVPWIGQWPYPLKPWFYRLKGVLVNKLFAPNNQKLIISELQAEPWVDRFIAEIPVSQQQQNFSLRQFQNNVEFAKRVGFDEIYLWGVEWWYFMKVQGYSEYWEYARGLFRS